MKKLILYIFLFFIFSQYSYFVFGEDLNSTNFKITGARLDGGGEATQSTTGDFKLLNTIGDFSGDPRVTSTNYSANIGEVEVFTANVPKIRCFETTTNGSSSCTTGPAYLNSGGMTRVCGPTGCYDRARFEIDTQNNPADTLYAIQISDDNFVNDIRYIDGVTKRPILSSVVTIDDYLTNTGWESSTFNIYGLDISTQYYLRAVALHGDFTESIASPIVSATTSLPTLSFDIDIAGQSGTSTETASPYTISFTGDYKLTPSAPAQTSNNLIWLDGNTNGLGGFAIVVKGQNGGLYSPTIPYTISSASADLDGTTEGFGIQSFYSASLYHTGDGALGTISTISPYNGSNNNVGIVSTIANKVYESTLPTHSARMALLLKARASTSAQPATDYSEIITITLVPRY